MTWNYRKFNIFDSKCQNFDMWFQNDFNEDVFDFVNYPNPECKQIVILYNKQNVNESIFWHFVHLYKFVTTLIIFE